LNPQIIYAKSEFLPTLVSSRIHTQLEFLAVGSWWVLRNGQLHKIPSTREDVFNDESLSMKDKRGLMKFLRYVLQEEEEGAPPAEEDDAKLSLKAAISNKFRIPASLQSPLLALALSPVNADSIPFDKALARIRRHLRSMGYFGQGFGAVIPKYGGTSEISQVACRAQAVGGGVYLLGYGLKALEAPLQNENDATPVQITLSDGTRIRSRYVAGSLDDIPSLTESSTRQQTSSTTWRSINVVASPLSSLFPPTSENGPNPAVAIVLIDDGETNSSNNPIYLQVHSEDTGECPAGQCKYSGPFTTTFFMMIQTSNTYLHCLSTLCCADNHPLTT
jgi:RAB protein geranylgeranyltransferase component A